MSQVKLLVVADHPIQYQTPLWAELHRAPELHLQVAYLGTQGLDPYFDESFGRVVRWELDLLDGYLHQFLPSGLSRLRALTAMVRECDVSVVHGYSDPWMLITIGICLLLRRPYMLRGDAWTRGRSHGLRGRARDLLVAAVVGRSAVGLAVGERNAAFYREFGCPHVVLAPFSVDNRRFSAGALAASARRAALIELGLEPDLPTVVFAGKLTNVKRPLDLMHAMNALGSHCNLLVLGDGPLKREARAASSASRTAFAGFVNQDAMPALLSLGDVLALPSSHEQWGLIVNEGMAVGLLPVVSEGVGCAEDLVAGLGEVHPVGDVPALAACLKRALAHPRDEHLRLALAQRLARFSLERTAAGFVAGARHAVRGR